MSDGISRRLGNFAWACCAVAWFLGGCASANGPLSVGEVFRGNGGRPEHRSASTYPPSEDTDLPVLDADAGLAEYLTYAALNNPGLEAAFQRWKAALERVPQVRALPDPRFTYRYFIEEVETRVGPQKQSFALAQTFPWIGKLLLRGDMATQEAKAVRQRYEAEKLELFYRVKDAYYEYYYLGRAIAVVRENRDLLKYLEGVARARYKAAAAEYPEVIRAQVELGKLEDSLRALTDLRGPVAARINAALNRPAHTEFPFPQSINDEHLSADDEQILTWASQSNPDLRSMDYQIASRRHAIDLADQAYLPDFTLGIDYTDVGSAPKSGGAGLRSPSVLRSLSRYAGGMGDLIDMYAIGNGFAPGSSPGDSGKDVWMVSLSMNLPIWYGKYAAGQREAYARYLAATRERAERENALGAQVKMVLYEYRDAERKIDLYRDTLVPKARHSLKSTEASFRTGSASFLDLVDAERTLLDFELSYERALAGKAQRLAELEMLVGREIPRRTPTEEEPPATSPSSIEVSP